MNVKQPLRSSKGAGPAAFALVWPGDRPVAAFARLATSTVPSSSPAAAIPSAVVSFVLSVAAAGGSDSLTAIAALVLAGITLALVSATIWLVLSTRAGTRQARADAEAALRVLERQVSAGYRPLLVDVLTSAPVPDDMGALYDVSWSHGANGTVHEPGPVIETKLPGMAARFVDPRSAFVLFEGDKIFLSIPLRNVGRGLAVIDGDGVELAGPRVGALEYQTIQRRHVPVGETTRIELVTGALGWQDSYEAVPGRAMFGIAWQLAVPYMDFAGQQRTTARLQIVCRGEHVDGPWLVERSDQESPHEEEPRISEPATAAASPQPAPSGRPSDAKRPPVTDLWGNPVRPRPRRR
jgi:hypothetical protein